MNNTTPESIGTRIKRKRTEKGLTKAELARSLGVTDTAVWNWEENGRRPRHGVLSSMANVLEVSTEWLVSGKPAQVKTQAETTVAQIIENAKTEISKIAGLPADRVKVHVEFVAD
jgi:transcriptional regulator with XRE-family HTH domain